MAKKHDPEFIALLLEHSQLNEATGNVTFKNLYSSVHLDFSWKGSIVSVPHSHLVWLIKHKTWPRDGMTLDHINDNPLDNRPENLQEFTHAEQQKKRRGRIISRRYGKGKYGYGIHIYHDKRDSRYYVSRYLSRGHGEGDLRTLKKGLGGYDTLAEAKTAIEKYKKEVDELGLDHLPEAPPVRPAEKTIKVEEKLDEIVEMRSLGYTIQQISDATGFCAATISNRTKNLGIDKRKEKIGQQNSSSKLNEEAVREIRHLFTTDKTIPVKEIALRFKVSRGTIYNIIDGKIWGHVT